MRLPKRGLVRTETGAMLWETPACAHNYAHARHLIYGQRQRVVPVRHEGRLLWRVQRATCDRVALEVAEPCS